MVDQIPQSIKKERNGEPAERRIDAGDVTLAWGDPGLWKARLREERLRAWAQLPIAERLKTALSMVRRRSDRDRSR